MKYSLSAYDLLYVVTVLIQNIAKANFTVIL